MVAKRREYEAYEKEMELKFNLRTYTSKSKA